MLVLAWLELEVPQGDGTDETLGIPLDVDQPRVRSGEVRSNSALSPHSCDRPVGSRYGPPPVDWRNIAPE